MICLWLAITLAQAQDSPWGDLLPGGENTDAPDAPPLPPEDAPVAKEETSAKSETKPKPQRKPTSQAPVDMAPQGLRVAPLGARSGLGFSHASVVGGDGGSFASTVRARYGAEDYAFALHLPFAGYNTPDDRETNLGNLLMEGWYHLPMDFGLMGVGLEFRFNLGDGAWTWTHQAEELWPMYGGAAVWQLRQEIDEATTMMYRGSFGVYSAQGYAPFPNTLVKFTAAAALDRDIYGPIGAVAEVSASYWDVSPFEVSTLVRGDILPGLRARGGMVFPLFVWSGWSPADQPSGMREMTLLIDVQMSL
jgi:hypothetical protein